jgi:hypothetical protein
VDGAYELLKEETRGAVVSRRAMLEGRACEVMLEERACEVMLEERALVAMLEVRACEGMLEERACEHIMDACVAGSCRILRMIGQCGYVGHGFE